jgi:hypothetical protein
VKTTIASVALPGGRKMSYGARFSIRPCTTSQQHAMLALFDGRAARITWRR